MAEAKDLAKFELFKPFSKNQLAEIAKITAKKTFKQNAHIYERGKPAKNLFVVSKGLVSLRRIEPGDKVGIAFETREPGTLFGAASFMQPQEYTLTAVCLKDTEVLAVDAGKLSKLCEEDPLLGYRLMLKIAQIYFERYKTAKRNLYAMVHTPAVITALPG
jgi:CRP-like cAMP-binding protein